ncbi:MAG: branched-chain amino acid ABC transporter permease [Thermodesulfobacteriota bacterium]
MVKKRVNSSYLFLIMAIFPIFTQDPYVLNIFITTGIWTIAAWGVRLIMSTGQLTLGHAAYMAIGAYASALLVMKVGLSFWVAFPLAGVISTLVALLIGYLTLRIKGVYFSIITFAFAEIIRLIIIHWPNLLGGYGGLANIPAPHPFLTIRFSSRLPYYYLLLALILITYLVMVRIDQSRLGKIFSSIHESDTLAESIGINIMKYKIMAFCIGCFFAGLSGSFYAHYFNFTSPEFFTIWQSIYCLIFVLVGGAGSVFGPLVGSFFLTLIPEILRVAKEYEPIIYAIILILVMFLLPGGLISLPARLWRNKNS